MLSRDDDARMRASAVLLYDRPLRLHRTGPGPDNQELEGVARMRIKSVEVRRAALGIEARQAAMHEADGGVEFWGCPACRDVLPIA